MVCRVRYVILRYSESPSLTVPYFGGGAGKLNHRRTGNWPLTPGYMGIGPFKLVFTVQWRVSHRFLACQITTDTPINANPVNVGTIINKTTASAPRTKNTQPSNGGGQSTRIGWAICKHVRPLHTAMHATINLLIAVFTLLDEYADVRLCLWSHRATFFAAVFTLLQ